jgi:hypothetical protein
VCFSLQGQGDGGRYINIDCSHIYRCSNKDSKAVRSKKQSNYVVGRTKNDHSSSFLLYAGSEALGLATCLACRTAVLMSFSTASSSV